MGDGPNFSSLGGNQADTTPAKSGGPSRTVWVCCLVFATIAAGVGVGVGVGITQSRKSPQSAAPLLPPPPRLGLNLSTVASKLLGFVPVDMQRISTGELARSYLDQVSRMQPVTSLLSAALPSLGLNDTVIQPQAIQMKLQAWFESNKVDGSSLAATVDTLAQLAQGVLDFQPKLRNISASLTNLTALVRTQVEPLLGTGGGSSGRRLLQQSSTQTLIRQAVQTVLSSPAAAPLVSELSRFYDPASLPDLVAALYGVLVRLAAAGGELRELMDRLDTHLDVSLLPSFPIYNPRTGANLTFLADPVPYDKRTTLVLSAPLRRRLAAADPLAAALLTARLPAEFTPVAAASQPRVLVPLVFHVMTYSQGGGFGPPNWERTPEYVARMVELVNAMARPANFAFFVNEVRYDPNAHPYLLKPDRASWMACASKGNYFYAACGEALNGAADYPRSINIFVVGDKADASYAGYGWVPSSPSDVATGHVALLWSVMDAAQWNSRAGWEYGAKVLWHEIMHHLGLYHTFGRGNKGQGCTAAADDGIPDTPIVAGPVYNQAAFAQQARAYCLSYFDTQLAGSWDRVAQGWRSQLGIPAADSSHGFDSCPSQPGNDELGNYIAYTHDVCIPALGHMTAGQAAYMHNATERYQAVLYRWGQYFAAVAPGPFQAPPPPPLSPPPPPSVLPPSARVPPAPPPPLSTCLRTRGGCRCRPSWSFRGLSLAGCANPDNDAVGLWCPVEQDGNCASAINGYWDYCAEGLSEAACAAELPRPPSPPPAVPRTPAVACGPGWVTASGSVCASDPWAMLAPDGTYNATHSGCANPDNDPQGSWCRLQAGYTALLGRTWDYCGPACNPDPSPPAPQPPLPPPPAPSNSTTNATSSNTTSGPESGSGTSGGSLTLQSLGSSCSASQGLPAGCTCRAAWGVVLRPNATAATGRRYLTARFCTALPELQTAATAAVLAADGSGGVGGGVGAGLVGVCEVVGCNDGSLDGRIMVCSSPCTQLTPEDGEDVRL